ncbi:MAG: SOS response-associated peptidase family protein [Hymenobacter sp.]
MCGRYTIITPAPALARRFSALEAPTPRPTSTPRPRSALPIITNAAPGQIQLVRWGLVPAWSRDPAGGPKPINARAETLAEKPSFRQLLARRRCLVLADSLLRVAGHRAGQGAAPHSAARARSPSPSPASGTSGWTKRPARCTPPSPSSPLSLTS